MDLQIVRIQVPAEAEAQARGGQLPVMCFPHRPGRLPVSWRVPKGKPGEWAAQSESGQFLVSLVPIKVGQAAGDDATDTESGFVAGLSFMAKAMLAYQGQQNRIKEALLIVGRESHPQAGRLWIGLALLTEDV